MLTIPGKKINNIQIVPPKNIIYDITKLKISEKIQMRYKILEFFQFSFPHSADIDQRNGGKHGYIIRRKRFSHGISTNEI
jgi:hypothetical protein